MLSRFYRSRPPTRLLSMWALLWIAIAAAAATTGIVRAGPPAPAPLVMVT